MMKKYILLYFIFVLNIVPSFSQTYFVENFDQLFVGSPAAPPGWKQTRIQSILTANGERDWTQNFWSGSMWVYPTFGIRPPNAVSGSGVLYIEDVSFGSSTVALSERRLESPIIDLSTSVSPYLRFYYFNREAPGQTMHVRMVISADSGRTWNTLSNILNGFHTSINSWDRINIPIPPRYRKTGVRIGIAIVNKFGSNNPFIDSVVIEEYTPPTIFSNGSGNWNATSTWIGGIIPTSENHVVIGTGHTITAATTGFPTAGIISRCQDLTVDGTLNYGTGNTNLLHVQGNLEVNGTLNAFNGISGRMVVVGGSVTLNSGSNAILNTNPTVNMGNANSLPLVNFNVNTSGFIFNNSGPAFFTNNGNLSSGTKRIVNVIHIGSDTFTYVGDTAYVIQTFALRNGFVNPNNTLAIGNFTSPNTANCNIQIVRGRFVSEPIWDNRNITSRSVGYHYSNTVSVEPITLQQGFEIPIVSGLRTVSNIIYMNTHNNVSLTDSVRVLGGLQFVRGIINTTTNRFIWYSGTAASLGAGVQPSVVSPSTNHGSYINGPMRVDFQAANVTYNIPLGVGSNFNTPTLSNNGRRLLTIAPGVSFPANTQILFQPIQSQAIGTANSPAVTLMGTRSYRIQRLNTGDFPVTTTLTMEMLNNNGTNTDSLFGNQNQLYIVQSPNITGAWNTRSTLSGLAAVFAQNTYYTRSASGIGPLNTQGEFFSFASQAVAVRYDSNTVTRETGSFSGGVPLTNLRIMRVDIQSSGIVVKSRVQKLLFRTTGTNNTAPIVKAKVFYTGNNGTFSNTTPFGADVNSPTDTMEFTGSVPLIAGSNFFWLVYDMNGSSISGDSVTAHPVSVTIDGISDSLRLPPPGRRISVAPMQFVNATTTHTNLSPITRGTTRNDMIRLRVNMTSLGSTIQLEGINANNIGSTNPFLDVDSITVWYTGNNPNFVSPIYFGGLTARVGAFTIIGSQDLLSDSNFFWITYNVPSFASTGNTLDAAITSMSIGGVVRTPIVSSPAGSRNIISSYCVSEALDSNDSDIGRVTFINGRDTLLNFGNGCGNNQSWAKGTYTNNTNISGINMQRGANISFTICYASSSSLFVPSGAAIYIDLNRNGTWESNEMLWAASATSSSNFTGSINIPCNVNLGSTRMRIVLQEGTILTSFNGCGQYSFGETEDYTINIVEQTPQFISTTTIQQLGTAAAANANIPILYLPLVIKSSDCLKGAVSNFYMRTIGSTDTTDISAAKIYKTNGNTFNTTTLLATINNPGARLIFNITDSTQNDTNHYWLTYDIASGATGNNVLDAQFDSITFQSVRYIPLVSNPSGNLTITAPMSYISATSQHPLLSKVIKGTSNNIMLRIPVIMSPTGAPLQATQFNLNTAGSSNPLTSIDSIYVWYTGNNSSFVNPLLFGVSPAQGGAFAINGVRNLLNDTNYFWLTYKISATANTADSVDAVLSNIVIAGINRIPADSNPIGSRKIRNQYCVSFAAEVDDGEILNVTIGSLNNSSTCSTTGGPGSVLNKFSDYSASVSPVTLVAGKPIPFSVHTATCGGNFQSALGIWIDINDDGDYTDAGEQLHTSPLFTYGPSMFRTGNLILPCPDVDGNYRIRVSLIETNTLPITSCQNYSYGETEEYIVRVVKETPSLQFASAIQRTDTIEANTRNNPILRIPIKANVNNCNLSIISQLRFRANGTTQISNITAAKIYKTTSALFDTIRLLGVVNNPAISFAINIQDTLGFDTSFYWLAYDISSTAANNNQLDAQFDSLLYNGSWQIPSVTNPAGNALVFTFMKYISSTAEHPTFSNPDQGAANVQILRIPVTMSTLGQALSLTQLQLSTLGTNNALSNIDSIKVWYTGTNSTFSSSQLFAATGSQNGAYAMNGNITLQFGINYFWVTYKLKSNAIIGDTLDASLVNLTINGVQRIPTLSSPVGFLRIRPNYCTPTYSSGTAFNHFISAVNLSNLSYVGSASSAPYFTYFDSLQAILQRGVTYTLTVTPGTQSGNTIVAWIDYNNDGTYVVAEKIGEVISVGANPAFATFTFTVPLNTPLLTTRLRILLNDSAGSNFPACMSSLVGETKDFALQINAATSPVTYIWNQTGAASFTTPSNWTPARTNINLNDRLVFNSGGNITVTSVPTQTVASITILNNTHVTLQSTSAANLGANDSLNLTSGRITTGNNVTIRCGSNTQLNNGVNMGTITGSGYVNGRLQRWINNLGSYAFPVNYVDTARTTTLNFTAAPTTPGTVTVTFIPGIPGTSGLPFIDNSINLNRVAENGVWRINPENGLAGGTFNLTLRADAFRGVQNIALLSLIRRNDSLSNWINSGSFAAASGTTNSFILNRTGLTQFGEFTVAGNVSTNPLPVVLVSFNAVANQNDAYLNWTTAFEQNNKGFHVERSFNMINFERIGFVGGKINSQTTNEYSYFDKAIFKQVETAYYRLLQEDMDGHTEYSETRVVHAVNGNGNIIISPNPFVTNTALVFNNATEGNYSVFITDAQGRLIAETNLTLASGKATITLEALNSIAPGIYFIQVKGYSNNIFKIVKSAY